MSEKLVNLLKNTKGYKTYATVLVIIVFGILAGFDIYELPTAWWIVLTAAGFGFMRSGIKSVEKFIEEVRKKQE